MTTATQTKLSGPRQNDILVDAGTNELEILTFTLGAGTYGVNVAKVREVLRLPTELVRTPGSHEVSDGVFRLRDHVVPLINLRRFLNLSVEDEAAEDRVIVMEFSQVRVAFRVDHVDRIHRVSWEQIASMPEGLSAENAALTSIAKIDENIVMMIDFERIVGTIGQTHDPDRMIDKVETQAWRAPYRILLAEDSMLMRRSYEKILAKAGYQHVTSVPNGQEAWEFLESAASDNDEPPVDLVVTDIEMPKIDGLHLCKRIKEHPVLRKLPVLVFSSLVSLDNDKKCKAVGVDKQIAKPALDTLVEHLDSVLQRTTT